MERRKGWRVYTARPIAANGKNVRKLLTGKALVRNLAALHLRAM
jgi:hypothetical protein